MIEKAQRVNQGDLYGFKGGVHRLRPRRARRTGVRVSIVATKLRNGSGAKGTQEGRDVVIDIRQTTLFPLSCGTNTNRNTYAPPWDWVAACVWTPRMLAALETNGVRGGKWHSLIDKVYALPNLYVAWAEVKANKGAAGVDHQIINAGQTPTLRRRGCSTLEPPPRQRVNPLRGKTTNRRAGCGRTACPVRREGEPKPIGSSYPYNSRRRDAAKKCA